MKCAAVLLFTLAAFVPRTAVAASPAECIDANERAIQERTKLSLRAAQRDFAVCADAACPAEISAECARQLHDVAASIPSILFVAQDHAGNDLTDVSVEMDGQPFVSQLGASATPVDPGEHTFVLTTSGHPSVTKRILVREGERDRRETIMFASAARAESLVLPHAKHDTTWRVIGGTLAGVGVVGVVLGSVFGVVAFGAAHDQSVACPAGQPCNGDEHKSAVAAHDRAVTMSTASTIAFVAGPAVLVLGGVIFFAAPIVRSDGVAIAFGGAF